MNVRLVPDVFNVAGNMAFFVEGHTSDDFDDWRLVSAPLADGRPNMTLAVTVGVTFDWTDTPWEGKAIYRIHIRKLMLMIGNQQRAFRMIPALTPWL